MNCRFLHHMEYAPMRYHYGMTNEPTIDGYFGLCKNEGCTFTRRVLGPEPVDNWWNLRLASQNFKHLASHRTAPGPSDRDKGSPYTTAGVN